MKRRDLLRRGAAVTTALGVAGIAGCAQTAGLTSSRPEYYQWLQAPGELKGETGDYETKILKPAKILENEEQFSDDFVSSVAPESGVFTNPLVEPESVQRFIKTETIEIFKGDFSTAEITDSLESSGYSQEDEFEGYNIYVSTENKHGWAISSDTLVSSWGQEIATDAWMRDVIEVRTGDKKQYVEESETVSLLTERVSDGYQTVIYPRDRLVRLGSNGEGYAVSAQLNGDTTELEFVFVANEQEEMDIEDIRTGLARTSERFNDPDEITANKSGRVATLTTEIETKNAVYWRVQLADEDFWVAGEQLSG